MAGGAKEARRGRGHERPAGRAVRRPSEHVAPTLRIARPATLRAGRPPRRALGPRGRGARPGGPPPGPGGAVPERRGRDRLRAARYFVKSVQPKHEAALRGAAAKENVAWIKSALLRSLASIAPLEVHMPTRSLDGDDVPKHIAEQLYAKALETTTSQLVHEIEPMLGTIRVAAESEIENFEESETFRALGRLDELVDALSHLRKAASSPRVLEFELDALVQRCIHEIAVIEGLQVQKAGPQPCVVEGDPSLVSLSFSNGLRNAVEATIAAGGNLSQMPITVAWGTSDTENWISILDVGIGFKGNTQLAFDIGTSNKPGHLGMGLATARQAVSSMKGRVLLVPNERGVRFEIRWPRSPG